MPNHCVNNIKIKFKNQNHLEDFMNIFFKRYESIEKNIIQKGSLGIIVRIVTAWRPDFYWLEKILEAYEDCWIKNEWHEEAGEAGVWVAYTQHRQHMIKSMKWNDMSLEDDHYCFNT